MHLSKKQALWGRPKVPSRKNLRNLQLDYSKKCDFTPMVRRDSPYYGQLCGQSPVVKGKGYCPYHQDLISDLGSSPSNYWPD